MRKIEWMNGRWPELRAEIVGRRFMVVEAYSPDERDDDEWAVSVSATDADGFVMVRFSGRGPTLDDAMTAAESRLRETCPGIWSDYASRVMVGDGVAA